MQRYPYQSICCGRSKILCANTNAPSISPTSPSPSPSTRSFQLRYIISHLVFRPNSPAWSSSPMLKTPRTPLTLCYLCSSTMPKSPKTKAKPKRKGSRSSARCKSDSAKKQKSGSAKKQKLTRTCLSPEQKTEKIKLINADCQRIIDKNLDEDHSYDALCAKHNLPRSIFFCERKMCAVCSEKFEVQGDAVKCLRKGCPG